MRHSIKLFAAVVLLIAGAATEAQARGYGAVQQSVAVGPRGGVAVNRTAGGVAVGPLGGVQATGARSSTYVGPGGTVVRHGSAGGVSRGPLGGVRAGRVEATRITTPGGGTYTAASAGRVGVGPLGGVYGGGVGGAAVNGPFGGAAVGYRGGAVGVGPYGGVAAGGGVAAVEHTTTYLSPNSVRAMAHAARSPYYSTYTSTWYQTHTTAWVASRWVGASVWAAPAWSSVSEYCGIAEPPMTYDYGSTVVIESNKVYVHGDEVGSAEQYADQAIGLADRGRSVKPRENEEFQPLGVFGLIRGEQTKAQHIFQLAVNKAGVVRGNYYDAVGDNAIPVYGSVDPKTQRVAWSIGEKKHLVFEAGLNNLTQDETPVLVHSGKDRTEQMVLVRLEEPREKK